MTNSNATTNYSLITADMLNRPFPNIALTERANVPGLQLRTSSCLKNDMTFKDNSQHK